MQDTADSGAWLQNINYIGWCDIPHTGNDGFHAIIAKLSPIKLLPAADIPAGSSLNSGETTMYEAATAPTVETVGGQTKLLRLGTLDTTQYQAIADLTGLGKPKTGQINQNQHAPYQQVLGQFSNRYSKKSATGTVYRCGSYRLMPHDENTAHVYFGPSIIDRPSLVEDDILPLTSAESKSMVAGLAPFVIGLLEDEHYMGYLKSKGLLKPSSDFWIEIAMDFYRDRAGAVGFHKDSLDLTIFVGLMFNNTNIINGPEFFYDTAPDQAHQKSVADKLPKDVLTDIAHFRTANQDDKNIYRSELEPYGWIMFTDETVNHSSPTLKSRAISGKAEKDKLLTELQGVVSQDKLTAVRKHLSNFPDDQKFYPEDIMHMVNNRDADVAIASVFVEKLGKANMSIVQINDCDPQNRETHKPIVDTNRESCTTNLNARPSRVSPGNAKLVRENSNQDLLTNITSQPQSNAPRQFIRLWVQVAPKK
jgi:hypothetical protein